MVVVLIYGLLCVCFVLADDYCLVDEARCDEYGVYRYMDFTSYEDFLIRDRLDDEIELTTTRPALALKKANITFQNYSDR